MKPPEDEEAKTEEKSDDEVEVKEEDETEKTEEKAPKKETIWEWVKANTATPLWRRSKSEITEQEVHLTNSSKSRVL